MQKSAVEKIVKLIELRFKDSGFCAKSMCSEIGVGMSTLHEFLSVRYGTTPHVLIETRRLTEALSLMKSNHSTLGAIASGCGFSSMRTFRRVFKRRLGMSPREASEKLRGSSENGKYYRQSVRKLLKAAGIQIILVLHDLGKNNRKF